MTDMLDSTAPARRRRSDALRSVDAILAAARSLLAERPDASMEEIAARAGVTRQTVYAHFPSRDALIGALLHVAGAEVLAAIDATHLDTAPPAEALRQFLDIGWQLIRRYPLLLDPGLTRVPQPDGDAAPDAAPDATRDAAHGAATARLEQLIRRGQRTGDFDQAMPATWLAIAILGLIHSAAGQVAAGRLDTAEAAALLLDSMQRLCGAAGAGRAGDAGRQPGLLAELGGVLVDEREELFIGRGIEGGLGASWHLGASRHLAA